MIALVSSQCTPLPADTPCGLSFEGQLINRTIDDFNKKFLKTDAIQKLFNANGCPNADTSDIQSLRYANSVICQQIIDLDFDKCNSTNTKPNLCRPQCDIASDTLNSLVQNSAKCTNAKVFADMKVRYDVTCSALKTDQACFIAADDLKYCGFPDEDSKKNFCSQDALANDECCIKFNRDSRKAIIIIISGCAVGALALTLIGLFIIRRRRRSKDNFSEKVTEIDSSAPIKIDSQRNSNEEIYSQEYSGQKSILKTQASLKRKKSIVTFAPDVTINNPSSAPSEFSEQSEVISINEKLSNNSPQNQESIKQAEIKSTVSENAQQVQGIPYNPPEGGQEVLVLYDFKSTLPDEISLAKNTKILLYEQFDDGWCLGFDPRIKQQGVFPALCVQINSPTPRSSFVSTDSLADTITDSPMIFKKPRVSSMAASDFSDGFRKGLRSKVPFNDYISELEKLVEDHEKAPENA